MDAELQVRTGAGVRWLTLDAPATRNALSRSMRADLLASLRSAATDTDVRAVVIRGAGGAFSSGADHADMGDTVDASATAGLLDNGRDIVTAVAELPKPVVAAVQGPAAGAAFSLALACDLIVADDTAAFHPAFRGAGLAPDWGFSFWFTRSVGLHRAKDILLTQRSIKAAQAAELGLVARVWPAASFEAELEAFATELAAGPTVAMGVTKRLLNRAADADLAATLLAESYGALYTTGTADHAEAVRAFGERRPPEFHGR